MVPLTIHGRPGRLSLDEATAAIQLTQSMGSDAARKWARNLLVVLCAAGTPTDTILTLTAVTSLTDELGHTRRGSEREREILHEIDKAVTLGVAELMGRV